MSSQEYMIVFYILFQSSSFSASSMSFACMALKCAVCLLTLSIFTFYLLWSICVPFVESFVNCGASTYNVESFVNYGASAYHLSSHLLTVEYLHTIC